MTMRVDTEHFSPGAGWWGRGEWAKGDDVRTSLAMEILCKQREGLLPAAHAAKLTSLSLGSDAASYFALVDSILADRRFEEIEAKFASLAERMKEIEAKATGTAVRREETLCDSTSPFGWENIVADSPRWPGIETVEFRESEAFGRDLAGLSAHDKKRVVGTISAKAKLLVTDPGRAKKEFTQSYRFLLHGGLESSLTEISIGGTWWVILTVDDDPIFGRVILTLMRLVRQGGRKKAYHELAATLYPEQILEIRASEV